MGEEMSLRSQRSGMPVRVLLAAGMVSLAAAGCASQGLAPGQSVSTGATGSPSISVPSSAASVSATGSTSDTASSSASDPNQASSSSSASALPTSSSSSTASAGKVYKVTDTVTEGGFTIKIHSITLPFHPPAGATFTPGKTRAWMLMDFEVTNVSTQPSMFSTLGAFDLRDSTNTSYISSVVGEDSLPDSKKFQEHVMKPGETARGEVVFDVPETAKGYRLIYKGNMWHASETPPVIMLGR